MSIRGKIFKCGRHRLMCGDATDKNDVKKLLDGVKVDLLLTDPPYGINVVKKKYDCIGGDKPYGKVGTTSKNLINKNEFIGYVGTNSTVKARKYKSIINDNKPFNPQHLLDLNVPSILFGANNYSHELPNNSKWIVWYKKPNLNNNNKNFSDCELAWTNLKGVNVQCYHHTWSGMIREGDRREELKDRIHPTQKPVGLMATLLNEYCPKKGVVLDLYGGSGSTLIACEKTGRTCYMMELSEDYCKLIMNRFLDYVKGEQKNK